MDARVLKIRVFCISDAEINSIAVQKMNLIKQPLLDKTHVLFFWRKQHILYEDIAGDDRQKDIY